MTTIDTMGRRVYVDTSYGDINDIQVLDSDGRTPDTYLQLYAESSAHHAARGPAHSDQDHRSNEIVGFGAQPSLDRSVLSSHAYRHQYLTTVYLADQFQKFTAICNRRWSQL